MRAVRALTVGSGFSADQPWLPGLPHVAAALATYFVFGVQACATGLLLATLASFVVYLPVTALALNGGRAIPEDGPAPAPPDTQLNKVESSGVNFSNHNGFQCLLHVTPPSRTKTKKCGEPSPTSSGGLSRRSAT